MVGNPVGELIAEKPRPEIPKFPKLDELDGCTFARGREDTNMALLPAKGRPTEGLRAEATVP